MRETHDTTNRREGPANRGVKKMITILKIRNADCDQGGWSYVVCNDYDITTAYEYFASEEEAEEWVEKNK